MYDFLPFHMETRQFHGRLSTFPGWPVDRKTSVGRPVFRCLRTLVDQTLDRREEDLSSILVPCSQILRRIDAILGKGIVPSPSSTSLETIPSSAGSKMESWTRERSEFLRLGRKLMASNVYFFIY